MKNINFRQLAATDNAEMASIIRKVLAEFHADKPGTVYFDPTTDDLFHLFSYARSGYFVAEENGRILGGSGVFPTSGLPDGCCELVKLYLLSEFRGLGIGYKLIELCFNKAIESGFTDIYLETMPELRHAIGLYEKTGFKYLPGPLGDSGHFGCDLWMIRSLRHNPNPVTKGNHK